jgi:uncharacterized phiE125 gp8 family phage protein
LKYNSVTRVTGPAVEPLTVAEAKLHLRVDTTEDDTYIGTLITAAREWVENYLDRTLITTQLILRAAEFPTEELDLPRPPMIASGTATAVVVTYTLADTTTATLSTALYRVDRTSTPGNVAPIINGTWPSDVIEDANAVAVTYWAGYGPTSASVPAKIRHACLMLIGHWYDRRSAVLTGTISKPIEFAVESLLASNNWGQYR